MSTSDSLKLCDEIAEQCSCSVCNGYLSCGPIRILPGGSRICGHCTPANPDTLVYRDLVLEKVLSKVSFPCHFKQYGCSERILFGQETDHESSCTYRLFACPVTAEDCSWEGFGSKLLDHFTEKHPDLIKDNAEIKVQIAQNVQGIFIVVKGSITIMVKYCYDFEDSHLKYDISYCANHNEYDVSFKMQLINDSDPEYCTYVKSKKCLPYSTNFYDTQNAAVLNLKKYCECLNHPECIAVLMNLSVVQSGTHIGSLDSFKCEKCFNYLIPPLFSLDDVVVCCDCGQDNSTCTPSNNQELVQRVNEIKFPCRWRNCTLMMKSDVYKMHERSCEYYIYKCRFTCTHKFKLADAASHYQEHHEAEYLRDKIILKVSFSHLYNFKYALTIKNNTIILFQHLMVNAKSCNTFKMTLFSTNPHVITGSIDFEHQHCTLKPKPFSFTSDVEKCVTLNELPPCFQKDEELTVTLTFEE